GGPGAVQVFVRTVQHVLVVGVAVHGREETLPEPERLVQHLHHGGEAVRRAGRVGHHVVQRGVVRVGVDAEHDRRVDALARRREHDLARPRLEMAGRVVPGTEPAGGLDHDVGADGRPVEVGRVALRGRPDGPPVHDEPVAVHLDPSGVPAEGRVVLEQVGEGRHVHDVVDADDLDVPVPRRTHDEAADPAEPVDADPYCHLSTLLVVGWGTQWATRTGQCACRSTCWLTEPRISPAKPPRPRAPTTSAAAPSAAATSTAADEPCSIRRSILTSGLRSSTSPSARSRFSSASSRWLNWSIPGFGAEAAATGAYRYACRAMSVPPVRRASASPSCSARPDSGDPSMPTTTSTADPCTGRTTATGQAACSASCPDTDPISSPAKPPMPRAPTTIIAASFATASKPRCGLPVPIAPLTSRSGWAARTASSAVPTTSSGPERRARSSCSSIRCGARSPSSHSHTWQITSRVPRNAAAVAAQSSSSRSGSSSSIATTTAFSYVIPATSCRPSPHHTEA